MFFLLLSGETNLPLGLEHLFIGIYEFGIVAFSLG